ncbi:tRNA preQ1(34) S-adenosylmethionine ribosyltransferase-isomerase QueA [Helicobacter sp. 11S03491-1]|uniref:tRNA preQ1(34) S-adenosylmethionine ribosyltransferase-isomerase QueA n=1 Tax=Helicobacter sp. 11S03491-1 TaxID=1476196 RepID=UPI000BA6EA50|nr:tRNA preQ1(34) S-adenosylmethionine ribosyltransferase-isomerase QueA [Helicobacter sp. 11S03491-1]PAF41348.1 tRNA preQ1(34) S-adenosylmethionine ribosyltransferase-isomerase QueA [Helicobacter sp. 11S03491-1]
MENDFSIQNYDYPLPKQLIASYPASPKESAKLLVYDRKKDKVIHSDFYHIFDFIPKDTLIVLNDTKVIKARIYGHKQTGGHIELLYHREIGKDKYLVQIKGRVKKGFVIFLNKGYECVVEDILDDGYKIVDFLKDKKKLNLKNTLEMLDEIGHIPLPPYIKRPDEVLDLCEYQSVFAKHFGAIAAPTASLHFSDSALAYLKKEFSHCFLTLHVGAGTFNSVETEDIREHQIHTERLVIPLETLYKIHKAKTILCVGTTALRGIEYYARLKDTDKEQDLCAECDVFLHLGNPVMRVNHLLTNFHLPKSSLIMLVASMVGLEKCKELYRIAIKHQYRFYSYGDGMLIL